MRQVVINKRTVLTEMSLACTSVLLNNTKRYNILRSSPVSPTTEPKNQCKRMFRAKANILRHRLTLLSLASSTPSVSRVSTRRFAHSTRRVFLPSPPQKTIQHSTFMAQRKEKLTRTHPEQSPTRFSEILRDLVVCQTKTKSTGTPQVRHCF